jgi:hypothetical protein
MTEAKRFPGGIAATIDDQGLAIDEPASAFIGKKGDGVGDVVW